MEVQLSSTDYRFFVEPAFLARTVADFWSMWLEQTWSLCAHFGSHRFSARVDTASLIFAISLKTWVFVSWFRAERLFRRWHLTLSLLASPSLTPIFFPPSLSPISLPILSPTSLRALPCMFLAHGKEKSRKEPERGKGKSRREPESRHQAFLSSSYLTLRRGQSMRIEQKQRRMRTSGQMLHQAAAATFLERKGGGE